LFLNATTSRNSLTGNTLKGFPPMLVSCSSDSAMKPVVADNGLGLFLLKLWMDIRVDKTEGQTGVWKRGTSAGTSQLL